ncbi:hypothetical protein F511_44174 [Dorcoceras hygrometricum]|uniref:Uncharacterized protein n=1 Tax=Dorcoceras hygrometricum TaxID=472368 RepID=A0A2Z7BF98_9LAMI|nr:hypothetical protein F511_44174 [Dorcoceras hygrometricum]
MPRGSWGDVARRFTMIRWCKLAKELRFWSWTRLGVDPADKPLKRQFPRRIGRSQEPRRHQGRARLFQEHLLQEELSSSRNTSALPHLLQEHLLQEELSSSRNTSALPGTPLAGRAQLFQEYFSSSRNTSCRKSSALPGILQLFQEHLLQEEALPGILQLFQEHLLQEDLLTQECTSGPRGVTSLHKYSLPT